MKRYLEGLKENLRAHAAPPGLLRELADLGEPATRAGQSLREWIPGSA